MKIMDLQRMQEIQKELQAKYGFTDLIPENGQVPLLWTVGEIGEMVDIVKKEGGDEIMHTPETRVEFIREWVDTLMYLNEIALCYRMTPEEITKIYEEKHATNMTRWDTEESGE